MRTNNRPYSVKKRITAQTPLYAKWMNALKTNTEVLYQEERYKVVDVSVIAGSEADEFYARRIHT